MLEKIRKFALAETRTRIARVAGEHSTLRPPVLYLYLVFVAPLLQANGSSYCSLRVMCFTQKHLTNTCAKKQSSASISHVCGCLSLFYIGSIVIKCSSWLGFDSLPKRSFFAAYKNCSWFLSTRPALYLLRLFFLASLLPFISY